MTVAIAAIARRGRRLDTVDQIQLAVAVAEPFHRQAEPLEQRQLQVGKGGRKPLALPCRSDNLRSIDEERLPRRCNKEHHHTTFDIDELISSISSVSCSVRPDSRDHHTRATLGR